ncbi:MAG: NAD(P)H-hydrate dehydratase [Helicobacteraceae bacterium]|nr:NAD(P)H-hydrate dehydratase [Helicobacteraceae bacterium]
MKNIYEEVSFLDKRAISKYSLSEEILMENAAAKMECVIDKYTSSNSMIIIVAGSGNNGADGLALARRLHKKCNIKVYMPLDSKTELNKIQKERFNAVGGKFIDKLFLCDIVIDCLFGSGFRGELSPQIGSLITQMNEIARLKIACDMPSGILINGCISTKIKSNETTFKSLSNGNDRTLFDSQNESQDGSKNKSKSRIYSNKNTEFYVFKADITISMGGLKLAYFSDYAKDFIGEIIEANLGISKEIYEEDSKFKLLEISDLRLPIRKSKNTHKGDFGHSCVIAGDKEGAAILSAMASFAFGSGLVSIIGEVKNIPPHIMNTNSLPKNCNAIAFGMGLGEWVNKYDFDFLGTIPSVIDADMFYYPKLKEVLEKGNLILTPHLKEFGSLLTMLSFGNFSISEIQENKAKLALQFSSKYPQIPLILKGANTFIAHNNRLYLNNLGKNNLSKGGSGDVLSGLIVSLLSQGYSLLDASINASLAHSFASRKIDSTYGLEPIDLIREIKRLEAK